MTDERQSYWEYRKPQSNNLEMKPIIIGLQNARAIIGRVVISARSYRNANRT